MPGKEIDNVLIVRGAFYEDMYENAWHRALSELKVKNEIFDTHVLTMPGMLGRIERRILWGPGIRRIQQALIDRVQNERPSVTLLYQGHYFDRQTLEQIRPYTFIAGYHNDDPFGDRRKMLRYRLMLPAMPYYHGFHVYRECNVPEALACGAPRAKVLKSYYLPWLDYPRKLSSAELEQWGCDVVFAGHVENDLRVECMTQLVRNLIKLRLYGEELYWKKFLPPDVCREVMPITKVVGDDYRKALCGSKIAACFFSKWNRDQYTRRSFEIPACGVFLLAERTPVMSEMFEEGKEAEFFSSPEEFIDKVKYYLANIDERKQIAEAGHKRVTSSGHGIHARMQQWLADIASWKQF